MSTDLSNARINNLSKAAAGLAAMDRVYYEQVGKVDCRDFMTAENCAIAAVHYALITARALIADRIDSTVEGE